MIPTLQVRPGMLLIYNKFHPHPPRKSKIESLSIQSSSLQRSSPLENLKGKKTYSGQLNPNSKKRLTKAINLLVHIAEPKTAMNFKTKSEFKFKVNFVTLTLPSPQGSITDKAIKTGCLDPWLKTMRRRYGLKSYVWRAERQFNGNVHFHITTDTYLPYDQIQDVWNHQISRIGLMAAYEEKHGHKNPNSTDIHSINQIRNLAGYMVKYMGKSPDQHLNELNQKRIANSKPIIRPELHPFRSIEGQPKWDQPISGKVWDCSRNLKLKTNCEIIIDSVVTEHVQQLELQFPNQSHNTDNCWMFFFTEEQQKAVIAGIILSYWLAYIEVIRNYVYIKPVHSPKLKCPPGGEQCRLVTRTKRHSQLDLFLRY